MTVGSSLGITYDDHFSYVANLPVTGSDSQVSMNTSGFDTPLTSQQEEDFQAWSKRIGKDPDKETVDYDLRGAFKAGINPAENGHFPDTFKKPNHPTFSEESLYHGVQGAEGGKWGKEGEAWTFTPGRTNIETHGERGLSDYFNKYEPDSKLLLPQPDTKSDMSPDPVSAGQQYAMMDKPGMPRVTGPEIQDRIISGGGGPGRAVAVKMPSLGSNTNIPKNVRDYIDQNKDKLNENIRNPVTRKDMNNDEKALMQRIYEKNLEAGESIPMRAKTADQIKYEGAVQKQVEKNIDDRVIRDFFGKDKVIDIKELQKLRDILNETLKE